MKSVSSSTLSRRDARLRPTMGDRWCRIRAAEGGGPYDGGAIDSASDDSQGSLISRSSAATATAGCEKQVVRLVDEYHSPCYHRL